MAKLAEASTSTPQLTQECEGAQWWKGIPWHSPCLRRGTGSTQAELFEDGGWEEPLPEWWGPLGSAVKVNIHLILQVTVGAGLHLSPGRSTPCGRLTLDVDLVGTHQRWSSRGSHASCQLSCSQLEFSHPECVWWYPSRWSYEFLGFGCGIFLDFWLERKMPKSKKRDYLKKGPQARSWGVAPPSPLGLSDL